MWYCLEHKGAFVHIPRSAGVSVTHALAEACDCGVLDLQQHRHMTAAVLRNVIGEAWDTVTRFAVARHPLEIIASDWRLTRSTAEAVARDPSLRLTMGYEAWLYQRRVLEYAGFEGFVRSEYLSQPGRVRPGGFWRTYCTDDGEDLGVVPVRHDRLGALWPGLCRSLGFSQTPQLSWLNHAETEEPAEWTPGLLKEICELCRQDFERFQWPTADMSISQQTARSGTPSRIPEKLAIR